MVSKFSHLYSKNAREMKASEIRELLKLTERKDIISFAGGLPNPGAFPVDKVREICNHLLDEKGANILQYGTTEGVMELRKAIADRMNKKGMDINYHNVLITSGSQQALDIIGKTFLDPDDTVIVGAPTYLGATNAFRSYGAVMEGVPLDENGMDPELLEEKIRLLQMHGRSPELLYLIPAFQNPSGVTIPLERRKRILDIAREYDMVVVEDAPYSELRYSGEALKPMKAMDEDGRVIYLGTFSKILAPGFRVAWCIAEPDLLNKLIIVKQASDLCTNTFGQHIAAEYLNRGYIDEHLEKIKSLYKRKRDSMLAAMDAHFPAEAKWTKPEGGMFIWVTLPKCIDTKDMFVRALENSVAYVHGASFFADRSGKNTMRLNFTYASDEDIDIGIKRLADTIRQELETCRKEGKGKDFRPNEEGLVVGV
ncbi:MAG: PLP-dependent aminotransferase family protein [Candidatus Thermoplasmatota archaeon]|nr:PLP-dependent aminotransferase family protein [Euryarchaeota archaeon]MBU4031686.1 PLP-dependent aminotransferase family protein [Candidatus Thermoplasmatota archaeon]MBU4070739.1 PLP-dependent aminotransferase family protein [Candidatus Thermoplasmatota archaeon]MBU4145165.1 PLP-dependent aminotransferase family protein [Candidatus Thermoplasmatota archaeon]MBU4591535.1 PLP-dependent aminotransferase family protein [Candidatus Thermoplasmatota archaeon]